MGDDYLSTAYTAYDKRVLYRAYDVTELVEDCLLYTSTAAQIEDFYKEFKGWADGYESAALERRRVILSQLLSLIHI